jgi:hypothetical protein
MVHVLPLCCFPPVRWWQLARSGAVNLSENYTKQTYRNRFDIADSHGLRCLSVPVQGQRGQKIPLSDILLAPGTWRKQQLSAIRTAYGKSPYFEHYFPLIEEVYSTPHRRLADFNFHALELGREIGLHIPEKLEGSIPLLPDFQAALDLEPGSRHGDFPPYPQVFSDRLPFLSDLSVIDLAMNLGPRTAAYIGLLG